VSGDGIAGHAANGQNRFLGFSLQSGNLSTQSAMNTVTATQVAGKEADYIATPLFAALYQSA
jgi:hypothetical protein